MEKIRAINFKKYMYKNLQEKIKKKNISLSFIMNEEIIKKQLNKYIIICNHKKGIIFIKIVT